jgi:hypothetical protein
MPAGIFSEFWEWIVQFFVAAAVWLMYTAWIARREIRQEWRRRKGKEK